MRQDAHRAGFAGTLRCCQGATPARKGHPSIIAVIRDGLSEFARADAAALGLAQMVAATEIGLQADVADSQRFAGLLDRRRGN